MCDQQMEKRPAGLGQGVQEDSRECVSEVDRVQAKCRSSVGGTGLKPRRGSTLLFIRVLGKTGLLPYWASHGTQSPSKVLFERAWGTSLVVQWMELCLPTQWVWIRSLVQEDSACRKHLKALCHNCYACVPQLMRPTCPGALLRNRSGHNEKLMHHEEEKALLSTSRESLWVVAKIQ